jgi:hypothetical protein
LFYIEDVVSKREQVWSNEKNNNVHKRQRERDGDEGEETLHAHYCLIHTTISRQTQKTSEKEREREPMKGIDDMKCPPLINIIVSGLLLLLPSI